MSPFNIIEGTGDWTYYEFDLTVAEAQDSYMMMIQMGGDSKENLDLYMKDFFLVSVSE